MPKTADGHIISPRYLPKGHPTLKEWREFVKTAPKKDWPSWLASDIQWMRLVRK